jgi:hypothetical protein
MSLKGSLEDVSALDVIQFIHIGKRTGRLNLRSGTNEATVGFQRGRITNASRTGAPRLGELLIAAEAIDQPTLDAALQAQEQERPRRSIGQVLIGRGAVSEETVRVVLGRHFGWLVQDLMTWGQGSFEFVLDEVWPLEELAAFPGDVAPKVEIDTQTILLEALSVLDDLKRSGERPALAADGAPGEPASLSVSVTPVPELSAPGAHLTPTPDLRPGAGPTALPRVQLVTGDPDLPERLRRALRSENLRVVAVPAREAGSMLPGEPAPLVVVDIRGTAVDLDAVGAIRRTRPRATVVAYCEAQAPFGEVYEAGAAAAVHGDEGALAACVESVLRGRLELSNEALVADGVREGFARLRRIVGELRSGLLSTTVSLNLMNAVAESLERAILFVIQQDLLIPLGAFGLPPGRRLPELTRSLQLTLREPSVFSECVETGRSRTLRWEEAHLPTAFTDLISRPRSGELAVLPVSGSQRVIAAIYVDNGSKDRPIADMPVLDLAAFQLGLALENEFLRRGREGARTGRDSAPIRNAS